MHRETTSGPRDEPKSKRASVGLFGNDDPMTAWTIGDATVTRVVDLELLLPAESPVPAWCVPAFATANGDVGLAFSAFAVAVGGIRVVVDPWLANDGPREGDAATGTADRLLGALAAAGFPAEEVDVVVNTHLDGIGWNTRPGPGGDWVPSFPRARYLWSRAQVDFHRSDDRLAPLLAAGVVEGVDPPAEVAPGLVLEDAPGHEAGHLAVRLRRGGHEALIGGHLFISPLQVADPSIGLDDDLPLADRTRRVLLAGLADRGGVLLGPLLGGPGGGRVHSDGPGWRLEVETADR
jgi:hypothetical protein